MPDSYIINLTRGDSYSFRVRRITQAGEPRPFDDARLQSRQSTEDDDAVLSLSIGDGIEFVGDDSNEVKVTISSARSEALVSSVWDLEVTESNGDVKTLVSGRLLVRGDVSRD